MRIDLTLLQSALLRNYHNSTTTTQQNLLKNDYHLFEAITDASSSKQEKIALLSHLFASAQNQTSYDFLDIPEDLFSKEALRRLSLSTSAAIQEPPVIASTSNPRKRPAEEELTFQENKSVMEWAKFFNPPKQSTSRRKPRSTHRAPLATSNEAPEALSVPTFKI